MRVLVVHNRYRSDVPSGENVVVDAQIADLRSIGIDVATQIEDSDRIARRSIVGIAQTAPGPIYSTTGVARFRRILRSFRPDIVHVHNLFPLISPAVINVSRSRGIPVLQTVHNFRHSCVNGQHFRDGVECFDCLGHRFAWPSVVHGCYRESKLQTVPMALGQFAHRRTFADGVNRFLCVSQFQASAVVEAGLPGEKVRVHTNSVADMGIHSPPGNDFLFLGRLSAAKGIPALLDAWTGNDASGARDLIIAGEGPLRGKVEAAARTSSSLRYVGALDAAGRRAALESAAVVVVPSVGNETFGLVAAEALAAGRPVIASRRGALPEMVDEQVGWLSEPTAAGLKLVMREASSSAHLDVLGAQARRRYLARYSPQQVSNTLVGHYEEVLASCHGE